MFLFVLLLCWSSISLSYSSAVNIKMAFKINCFKISFYELSQNWTKKSLLPLSSSIFFSQVISRLSWFQWGLATKIAPLSSDEAQDSNISVRINISSKDISLLQKLDSLILPHLYCGAFVDHWEAYLIYQYNAS